MKKVIIDTNILLRFLIKDKSTLQTEAVKIFSQAEKGTFIILLNELIIAECIWVMLSHYQMNKKKVIEQIKELIIKDEFEIRDKTIIDSALDTFSQSTLSWIDCYLLSQSKLLGLKLFTFDQKLARLCK